MKAEDVLQALVDMVAEKVIAAIGPKAPVIYTSAPSGPFCPGKSHAWMKRNVKTMLPGAKKVGRHWQIAAADYEWWANGQAAEASRKSALTKKKQPKKVTPPLALIDEADELLANAGLRKTKKVA